MSRAFRVLFNLVGIAFLVMGCCLPAQAQRVTQLDGGIDASGGWYNYPANTLAGDSSLSSFYSVSPSLSGSSRTARSTLGFSYAFGWNYYPSGELGGHSTSHSASLSVSRELSPRWSMRVSDSYNRTNDIRTFYAIRGIAIEEEAIVVYFYPVTTDSTLSTNSLSVGFDHTLSPRSTLNFSAGHSFSYYPEVEGAPAGLSGLKNISGSASYTRRLNDRTSMSVGYNGSYYSFDKFSSAVSTAVIVGLSSLVAKNTTVSISAGPSRVNNLGPLSASNTNLAASLSISKTIKENSFHASISNNNATASGVGTLSNTRSLTAGVSRNFGRRVSAFADFSAFDGTGIVGNPYRTRGTSATANMGYSLARNLSARAGISFQRYTQPSPYAYTQRQIFAGLHYSHPNLLRSH